MKLLKLYFPLCLSIFFFASCQDSNQDTDPILDNVCVQFDISALVAGRLYFFPIWGSQSRIGEFR